MAKGKGNLCNKILAAILLAACAATIVAVCIVYIPKHHHNNDHWLKVLVTNEKAFDDGGASHHPTNKKTGVGAGDDKYTTYTGKADAFPDKDKWVSFKDMWKINKDKQIKTSCTDHKWGENNSDKETDHLYDAIQDVAKASLVDNRLILAIIMQESKGCVRVHSTNNGVQNPGLMQSHNGTAYDPKKSKETIRLMVQDGTQGTPHGKGLVQYLDQYGNAYAAARGYNSGAVASSGNLSDAIGATPCYASDVANRLTGWVKAPTQCGPEAKLENGGTGTSSGKPASSSSWSASSGQWNAQKWGG